MNKKIIIFLAIIGFILILLLLLFFNKCDYVTGFGIGKQRECTCYGFEITLRDDVAYDGIRDSRCLGIKHSKCYTYSKGYHEELNC